MASTAKFALALNGASVGSVSITGTARTCTFWVASHPANDIDAAEILAGLGSEVDVSADLAGALWRSLSEESRAAVRALDPELAADLDSTADWSFPA